MILLADDDSDILAALAAILDDAGLAYVTARSGREALIKAKQNMPELVILDVEMPELDGFQAYEKLREMPAMQDVPILFLSASAGDAAVVAGLNLGADDYLTKPFKPAQLLAKIRNTLSRYRQRPPKSFTEFKPGAVIQRQYRVIEQVGHGGMATVYRVEDLQDGHPYALKVLHGVGMNTDNALERFSDEIRALWAVTHPNIVEIHDSFVSPELCYYTMNFIEGPTLADRMNRGEKFHLAEALYITAKMADALSRAHEANILHRDVKPPNILFGEDNEPILNDFGLVYEVARNGLTQSGTLMGTPHYMSPEQVHSPRDLDERSDIYQLGVVLYEMVTRKTPFWDKEDYQSLFCTSELEVPSPAVLVPTLPQRTVELCLGALANKREARFQTAADMAFAARMAIGELY